MLVAPDGTPAADQPLAGALLSGSFNPLHAGHERLAEAAAAALGVPVTFELPILNAEKPPLGYAEIERRLAQFRWRYPVALSRAALFVEKAALFPGCVFVLGYDTAARLVDPRYYGGAASAMRRWQPFARRAVAFWWPAGCRMASFTPSTRSPSPLMRATCSWRCRKHLRVDLSSSAIRERMG